MGEGEAERSLCGSKSPLHPHVDTNALMSANYATSSPPTTTDDVRFQM
jgi:hypothetical protein